MDFIVSKKRFSSTPCFFSHSASACWLLQRFFHRGNASLCLLDHRCLFGIGSGKCSGGRNC